MILDTSAIIDIIRGDSSVIKKVGELENKNIPLSTTSISVFEIWQGTKDIKDEMKKGKIEMLIESIGRFSFDIEAAKEAGMIHASLSKAGEMIEPEDSMIAGIALIHNEIILTKNIKHFGRIENLKIEIY